MLWDVKCDDGASHISQYELHGEFRYVQFIQCQGYGMYMFLLSFPFWSSVLLKTIAVNASSFENPEFIKLRYVSFSSSLMNVYFVCIRFWNAEKLSELDLR